MANAKIAYLNLIDASTTVISASSAVATFPASNVATTIIDEEFWQPTANTGATLSFDLGSVQALDVLAVVFSRFGPVGSTDTVTYALDAATPGGSGVASGTMTGLFAGYNLLFANLGSVSARYITLTFNGTSLTPAQYVRVGRVWAGPSVQVGTNYNYGLAERWDDASVISTSPYGGSEFIDNRPRRRMITCSFDFATLSDAESFKEIDRVAGLTNQLLFVPDPAGTYVNREAMVCRLAQITDRANISFGIWKKPYTFRQSL